MSRLLQTLGKVFRHITRETIGRIFIPLSNWFYPYPSGDEVWVTDHFSQSRQAFIWSSW